MNGVFRCKVSVLFYSTYELTIVITLMVVFFFGCLTDEIISLMLAHLTRTNAKIAMKLDLRTFPYTVLIF